MQRSRGGLPAWERQVGETLRRIRARTKRRRPRSTDVHECLGIFVADQLRHRALSYSSIRNHYRHLSLFVRWLTETHPALTIDAVDDVPIREYFSSLQRVKHYKPLSLQIVQIVLRRFFHSMLLRRLVRANPVGQLRIRAAATQTPRSLPSAFQLMRLLGGVREHYQWLLARRRAHRFSLFIHRRDLCIFSLCVACGLRRAELERTQRSDLDWERLTIRIAGKGSGRFTIRERLAFFSHPFLQQVLQRYRQIRDTLPGSSFFCNWVGDPLSGRSIEHIFKSYNSFLRPPVPYTPTLLRKAFCTYLALRKLNVSALQALMGHEKCETTLDYYVKLTPEQLERTWKETTPYAHRL